MIDRRFVREARIVAGVVGALALGIAATSCAGSTETTVATEPPSPLEAEFSGCAELWAGTICELPEDGKLRLWVKAAPSTELTVRADGEKLAATRSEVQDGAQLRVTVPAGAHALSVTRGEKDGAASFTLKLSEAKPIAALVRAEKLRQNGKFDEASAEVAKVLDDPATSVRARALGKAARIAFARGDVDGAVKLYGEALSLDREAGLVSGEVEDRFGLAYTLLLGKRSFTEANLSLASAARSTSGYPDGRAKLVYNEGQLAQQTGDLGGALRLFRTSEQGCDRLGLDALKLDSQTQQLIILHEIGRDVTALRKALAAQSESANPAACKRAEMKTNMGWSALAPVGNEDHPAMVEEAVRWLNAAAALYRIDCPAPRKLANALGNLAFAELAQGRMGDALRHVTEARLEAGATDARVEVLLLEVEGRVALEQGNPALALQIFGRLSQIADSGQLVAKQIVAALGQADAYEALGQPERIGSSYGAAERLLDSWTRLVPLGRDRDAFLGNNEHVSRQHVDFLIRVGALAEAATAARKSRARSLVALQSSAQIETLDGAGKARWYEKLAVYRQKRDTFDAAVKNDWKLPADDLRRAQESRAQERAEIQAALDDALSVLSIERTNDVLDREATTLPQPTDGDLFLVFHPVRKGWAGFALTSDRALHHEMLDAGVEATPEEIAASLLARFHDELERASRIRFLAYGALDRLDLHALTVGDKPVLAFAPVEYGLDLPGGGVKRAGLHGSAALVVSDPSGNLTIAHDEGMAIVRSLEEVQRFRVQHLDGRDARVASVRRALEHPEVDHFHYAGHGQFSELDGDDSKLVLSDAGAFSLHDILTLQRSPRFVVLSGCETARASEGAHAVGLGLAQAFIVSGASVAIAATTRVDDKVAGRMMTTFYGALTAPEPRNAAAALQTAELEELRRTGTTGTNAWASFRVLVP